jgi:hypothetical protein
LPRVAEICGPGGVKVDLPCFGGASPFARAGPPKLATSSTTSQKMEEALFRYHLRTTSSPVRNASTTKFSNAEFPRK